MAKGFIRQRGNSWQVVVYAGLDPVTGKPRKITRHVQGTRRQAERVRARIVVEVNEGRHRSTEQTVGVLIERWFAMRSPDLSPTTARTYRGYLDRQVLPVLGGLPLHKLDASILDGFYGRLRSDGLAPASVRQVHAILRRALGQGVRWGWLAVNPAANATPPPRSRLDPVPPTAAEAIALLAGALTTDRALGVQLWLAAATGARRGEVCALRWSDFDLTAGTVTISRSVMDTGALKDTKTHAARRLALDPVTVRLLADHRARAEELAATLGVAFDSARYVFGADLGGRLSGRPDTFTHRFVKLRRSLGLPEGLRLHDLRHFAATQMIAAGVNVRTVSGRLGHANTATTLNVYAHALPAPDRAAAEILGRLLSPLESGQDP